MRYRAWMPCLLAALFAAGSLSAQDRGDCQGRRPESWSIVVTGPDEPGERLVVEGRVVKADGTPVPDAEILIFQTDAEGYYSPDGMDERNARLCGWMRTGSDGRYRFETIRPAHYASGGAPPAHVHYRVWANGGGRQSFTLNFEGDPKLGARGADASGNPSWATIRPVARDDDGTLRVARDLKLR